MAEPSETCLNAEQIDQVEKNLSPLTDQAAAISVLSGFAEDGLIPNIDIGCQAVRIGIDCAAAESFRNHRNLSRFLTRFARLRDKCIGRVSKLSDVDHDDVERVISSVQLQLNDALSQPIKGAAIHRLSELDRDLLDCALHFLHSELGRKPNQATAVQISQAWDKAIALSWKRAHPRTRWGVTAAHIAGAGLLAVTGFAFDWWDPALAWSIFTAGILISLGATLWVHQFR